MQIILKTHCIFINLKIDMDKDNREYCRKNCKGFQESGGRCFFDDDCEEKKKADKEKSDRN